MDSIARPKAKNMELKRVEKGAKTGSKIVECNDDPQPPRNPNRFSSHVASCISKVVNEKEPPHLG